MDSSEYQYSPLSLPKSIRLLKLQHSLDFSISFDLHTTELDSAPPYDCLSYTWGDPRSLIVAANETSEREQQQDYDNPYFPVTCDGRIILIRRNLRDALHMLQTISFASLGKRKQDYIWIDALCVNQADLNERGSQVQLMTDIFSSAQMVIAWLGPGDEYTADAGSVIERLAPLAMMPQTIEEYHNIVQQRNEVIVAVDDILDPDGHKTKLGIEPITQRHWQAWVALLCRSYFRRVWIIQELILAKLIVAVCGFEVFNWNNFSSTMLFLQSNDWLRKLKWEYAEGGLFEGRVKMKPEVQKALNSAWYLERSRAQIVSHREFMDLGEMVRQHRRCSASDPRDKVFAFLRISSSNEQAFACSGVIVPDYNCSVHSLYTRTTRLFLRSAENLEYLTNKELRRWTSIHGLPSWVPDYAAERRPNSLGSRGPNCPWGACGTLEWEPDSREWDDPLLDIQGIMVGRIVMKAEMIKSCEWSRYLASICEVAQRPLYKSSRDPNLFPADPEPLQSLQTPLEILWRTLVADTFKKQHPASLDCGEQFIAWAMIHLPRLDGNCENDKEIWEKATPMFDLIDQEPSTSIYKQKIELLKSKLQDVLMSAQEQEHIYKDFKYEFRVTSFLKRLFRTDGEFLGNGPEDIETGDEVWVLAGSRRPAVLRKLNNGNRVLVGEAYVHNLMYGEFIGLSRDIVNIVLE